ncbi:hypothetical protein CISG_05132 [Coccidioides immitis RMSCC 3703]|uniref:Uncharacterized protein n=1 Tax=Coccidioides immitis RMSCC 3703 TaxID=454286 RepID=A0A0J8QS12_COCIT|nr:hypothetical protein CISG_05132 [Coccidioides immitis RMSCC 3703]
MPSKLSTPVLTVDPAKIHEVDTRSAESLHGMWMVFSRCADYMEEGRRLENLSWRLWNLETFCTSPPTRFQKRRIDRLRRESKDIPELSTSVDSAASDEAERIENQIKSPPKDMDIKPRILGVDPMLSMSRGRERHITSIGLEKMVYKIKEKKSLEPIAALPTSSPQEQQSQQQSLDITPRAASPYPNPQIALEANDSEASRTPASDTSVSSAAHSPRTTRRNMLATELTESLRRHLLWERQQKTAPAAAAFKRRHTAHDMANLQEYPGPKPSTEEQQQPQRQPPQAVHSSVQQVKDKEASKNNSWNHYFDYGPWEYHVKGW